MLGFFKETQEFDFEKLRKANVHTIFGAKVKIDRIVYDITKTTPVAVSGTFVIRGIKIRGNWDVFGKPLDMTRCFQLSSIFNKLPSLESLFQQTDEQLFTLVQIEEIENKKTTEQE